MKRISIALLALGFASQVLSQGYDKQALAAWSVGVDPDKVIHAINCGSNEDYVDLSGVTYKADYGFNGGVTSDDGMGAQWVLPNCKVYETERYGNGESFKYHLTIPSDGVYALVAKFSEIYFNEPGSKVFDIKLGDQVVVGDLDIFEKVESRGIPYDEFIEFNVKGGKVYFQGQEAKNAIKNGKLVVEFARGQADNPKVNAILLVDGGLVNTHYKSHKRYIQELEKIRKLQKQQYEAQTGQPQGVEIVSNYDYWADDEDISQPKNAIGKLIDQHYVLEGASVGFLFIFFAFLSILGGDSDKKKQHHHKTD